MPYKTKLIKKFRNYESFQVCDGVGESDLAIKIEPKDETKAKVIEDFTLVMEDNLEFIVPCIYDYLISRHREGKTDSSEAKALRLYFDFLESDPELEWDIGSPLEYERPIKQFSAFLEDLYHSGGIAGTTATSYFRAVCRFYTYHLKFNYPFKKGVPVEFEQIVKKKFANDLTSHISGLEIVIDTATCRPNINANDSDRRLIPLSEPVLKTYFPTLKKYASIELCLICSLAVSSGMRAKEIGDLRLDMISKYAGEEDFTLRLGPPSGHSTKKGSSMPVDVPGAVIQLLIDYTKSPRYLKRLKKSAKGRVHVFLDKNGNPYTQKMISTLFGQFNQEHIIPFTPSFNHKFQDLRATFGLITMKAAIDSGWSKSACLAYTKKQMRHRSIVDTLRYLEYWQSTVARHKQCEINERILAEVFSILGDA